VSVHRLLFRKRLQSKETILKRRALPALMIALIFCGLLTVLGCSQGHGVLTQVKTETVPSGYFELTVCPAEVRAAVGEQIEIRCSIECLINTVVEINSVDVLLFDSHGSMIREQAMAKDSYWSAQTVYTVVGDEAYFQLKVNFSFPGGPAGNYSEYSAQSFPIVVGQE
jgi:hypothetical protein